MYLNHVRLTCSTQSLTHDCVSVLNLVSLSHVTMNTAPFATNRTSYWDTLHLWFFTGVLIGGLWTLMGFVELTCDRPSISCGTRSMLVLLPFRLVWKSHLFLSMSKWQYISVGLQFSVWNKASKHTGFPKKCRPISYNVKYLLNAINTATKGLVTLFYWFCIISLISSLRVKN